MVTRAGHSLAELIVAVTFLATTLVAVGAAAVVGGRWTTRAVARQEAVLVAGAVLDSLADTPAPGPGVAVVRGLRVRWWLEAGSHGPRTRVQVSAGQAGPVLVELPGYLMPDLPVLPDDTAPARPGGLP